MRANPVLAATVKFKVPLPLPGEPLLIVIQLEEYDYAGAASIAVVMLLASFALLLGINLLQAWSRRRMGLGARP